MIKKPSSRQPQTFKPYLQQYITRFRFNQYLLSVLVNILEKSFREEKTKSNNRLLCIGSHGLTQDIEKVISSPTLKTMRKYHKCVPYSSLPLVQGGILLYLWKLCQLYRGKLTPPNILQETSIPLKNCGTTLHAHTQKKEPSRSVIGYSLLT